MYELPLTVTPLAMQGRINGRCEKLAFNSKAIAYVMNSLPLVSSCRPTICLVGLFIIYDYCGRKLDITVSYKYFFPKQSFHVKDCTFILSLIVSSKTQKWIFSVYSTECMFCAFYTVLNLLVDHSVDYCNSSVLYETIT